MLRAAWLKSLLPFVGVAAAQANVTNGLGTNPDLGQEEADRSADDDGELEALQPQRPSQPSPPTGADDAASLAATETETEELMQSVRSTLVDDAEDGGAGGNSGASGAAAVVRHLPFPDLQPTQARIAVSACLMGHEVRYNGGHCNARTLFDTLSKEFQFVPVCPEMDIGLGVPRATLRLVSDAGVPLSKDADLEDIGKYVALYCPEKDQDLTTQMKSYTKDKVKDLQSYGCDGFVLKKDSPSCGLSRVKLYQGREEKAAGRKIYQGMFANTLIKEWPELPVAEEGMLLDEDIRNTFLQQVSCHARWRLLDGSFKAVVKFHETHKYILMAQDPNVLRDLGRLLAKGPKHYAANNVRDEYYSKFFMAMKVLVSRGRHVNVLNHLAGYLRKEMKAAGAEEMYQGLLGSIQDYQEGLVPLVVPLKLLQLLTATLEPGQEDNAKELLQSYEYIKGVPRSLKAHTTISDRLTSKVPLGVVAPKAPPKDQ